MNQSLPASVPPYAGAPDSPRRAFRSLDDALVGGVASGLARHLGVPVLWMRAAFLIATAVGGFGIVTYAALWLLLPAERHFEDSAPGLSAATRQGKRQGRRAMALADAGPLVALAAIAIGVIALVAGLTGGAVFLWPLLLAAVGIGVLWRQADEAQRERWRDTTGRIDPIRAVIGLGGWASYARIIAGVAFLVGAIVLFAVRGGNIGVARDAVIAALLAVLGVGADDRPLAVPAVVGPDRGAGRADPLAGAGRRGGAPARLGAADAGADPEARPTTRRGGPAREGSGA